jgi:protein-disulfide isomerase
MSKGFWAIIAVIVVVFAGLIFFNNKDKDKGSNPNAQVSSHVEGNTASKVKLVEYGDFQCPVCGGYYPVVKQVVEKYKDKISFQFANLPLSQVHQNAFAGARAAEAASKQNKYWEMHDLLYQNQSTWSESKNPNNYFNQYANQLGLNSSQFQKDFASAAVNDTINADVSAFKKTGAAMATPAFFLNGKQVQLQTLLDSSNTPTVDNFSKLLDEAIVKAGQ